MHIMQDSFFHKADSGKLKYLDEIKSFNYDCLQAIDVDKFYEHLNKILAESDVDFVFVDGFLLFHFDIKFDKMYFFTLTKEQCQEKRSKRKYKTVDNPGYFDQIVWPCYTNYYSHCKSKFPDIVYLDGSLPLEHNLNLVKQDLLKLLNN